MSIWGELQYLPLGVRHFSLLAAIYFVVVAWLMVRAFRLASMRIGLGSNGALILLTLSLSLIHISEPTRPY